MIHGFNRKICFIFNNQKRLFLISLVLIILLIGFVFLISDKQKFEINQSISKEQPTDLKNNAVVSPISGLECENYQKRPIAVMLSGDEITRPLSGVSQADLIIEMPVMKNGVNRFMAVFICEEPLEIGSIRSARHDFIPLALGLNAVFAHWGGSYLALGELDKNIIDNIDAIYGQSWAFYRKPEIPQPHNGFTSMLRLRNALNKLDYREKSEFSGYLHCMETDCLHNNSNPAKNVLIKYPGSSQVKYIFNQEENNYWRWRGQKAEIDKNNGQQVKASVVAVLRTNIKQPHDQYNEIEINGQGRLDLFQSGQHIVGFWSNIRDDSGKLYFLDNNKDEIALSPGQIWVQIIDMETEVEY